MEYPNFNTAATEAAIMGYAVLFYEKGHYGVTWWEGEHYYVRGLWFLA